MAASYSNMHTAASNEHGACSDAMLTQDDADSSMMNPSSFMNTMSFINHSSFMSVDDDLGAGRAPKSKAPAPKVTAHGTMDASAPPAAGASTSHPSDMTAPEPSSGSTQLRSSLRRATTAAEQKQPPASAAAEAAAAAAAELQHQERAAAALPSTPTRPPRSPATQDVRSSQSCPHTAPAPPAFQAMSPQSADALVDAPAAAPATRSQRRSSQNPDGPPDFFTSPKRASSSKAAEPASSAPADRKPASTRPTRAAAKNAAYSDQADGLREKSYPGKKVTSVSSSKYRGVSWHAPSKQWRATIFAYSKPRHLGYFHDEEEGARAYDLAAVQLRPTCDAERSLNFPQDFKAYKEHIALRGAVYNFDGPGRSKGVRSSAGSRAKSTNKAFSDLIRARKRAPEEGSAQEQPASGGATELASADVAAAPQASRSQLTGKAEPSALGAGADGPKPSTVHGPIVQGVLALTAAADRSDALLLPTTLSRSGREGESKSPSSSSSAAKVGPVSSSSRPAEQPARSHSRKGALLPASDDSHAQSFGDARLHPEAPLAHPLSYDTAVATSSRGSAHATYDRQQHLLHDGPHPLSDKTQDSVPNFAQTHGPVTSVLSSALFGGPLSARRSMGHAADRNAHVDDYYGGSSHAAGGRACIQSAPVRAHGGALDYLDGLFEPPSLPYAPASATMPGRGRQDLALHERMALPAALHADVAAPGVGRGGFCAAPLAGPRGDELERYEAALQQVAVHQSVEHCQRTWSEPSRRDAHPSPWVSEYVAPRQSQPTGLRAMTQLTSADCARVSSLDYCLEQLQELQAEDPEPLVQGDHAHRGAMHALYGAFPPP